MNNEEKKDRPGPENLEIERDIRLVRKPSLAEAIGNIGGLDILKGASPVTQKRQTELEIKRYLEKNLVDVAGALEVILLRDVSDSQMLVEIGYDQPLKALRFFCDRILSSERLLQNFVNDVDAEWGRIYLEPPHFQKEGCPPHPDDQYTFSSVRITLTSLVAKLQGE